MVATAAKTAHEIGPYSRPLALAKLDGRTREAALMRRVRAELTAHVGGSPTFPQRLLIERCAVLSLRLAKIDEAILAGDQLTLHDNQHAIAWHNALRRSLDALGLEPAASPPEDPMGRLNDYLRRAAAERERERSEPVMDRL